MPASTALATVLGVAITTALTTPSAASPAMAASQSTTATFAAIAVNLVEDGDRHDLEVVLVQSDGTEQLVRLISHDLLPDDLDLSRFAQVSQAGWIAVSGTQPEHPEWGGAGTLFVDLADPSSTSRYVDGLFLGGRWSPTGDLYVDQQSDVGTVIIDPSIGTISEVPGHMPVGGRPETIWSADGTALLSQEGGDPATPCDDVTPQNPAVTWSMTPIDGGADRPGVEPLFWSIGGRSVADDGSWICEDILFLNDAEAVTVVDPPGQSTLWYDDELLPGRLDDRSFSTDGTAVWLLLDLPTETGSELTLARLDQPGGDTEILNTVSMGPIEWPGLHLIAPDDSVVVVDVVESGTERDEEPVVRNWLIPTDGSTAIEIDSYVAGLVPAATAASLLDAAA